MSESETNHMRSWFGRVKKMDKYFLEERCSFSHRRKIKLRNVKITAAVVLSLIIGFILFSGNNAEQKAENQGASFKADDLANQTANSPKTQEGSIAMGEDSSSKHFNSGRGTLGVSRQYGASQIVRADGAGNGFGLPMGSTLSARLTNTLLSSDSSQPVIAEIIEDAVWHNSVLIPSGSRAIGNASFDDASKRLQIRFHTFVYPEGDQHSVSALALLENGSSGLPGDFHSGTTQKQVGRFFGNFVGGLAEGMKDRQAGGTSGIAFEPGSLRNGLLDGVAQSSLDQAKSFSEGIQNVHPYLEVPGGTVFVLYFEKEYSP